MELRLKYSNIKGITARALLEAFEPLKVVKLQLEKSHLCKTTEPRKDQLDMAKAISINKIERILKCWAVNI